MDIISINSNISEENDNIHYITSNEYLKTIIENNYIKIIKKAQKTKNASNYYISPNLRIKLYNCKLMIANANYFVLIFDKKDNMSLLLMLRSIDNMLYNYIKSNYYISNNKIKYSIHSETDEIFTIRCTLPHYKNKYFITCDFEEEKNVKFTIPKTYKILKSIHIELRNLWETPEKIGYNTEVKYINY